MRLKSVIKEATRIMSVNIAKGTDASPNPKAGLHTNKIIDIEKKGNIIPKIFSKKEMKDMEYYIPDLPDGALKSVPPELRHFYSDIMNDYAGVAWLPFENLCKYRATLAKMKKKFPKIPWDKILPTLSTEVK